MGPPGPSSTPAGTYGVSWRRGRSGLRLNLEVPPNAGAHCSRPATSPNQVTEVALPSPTHPASQ